jgi:type VI secretion system protein ImpB
MLSQSVQSKLSRVRKPRVHITYDVETEGAVIQKELPFVVGVLGDFTGKPAEPLPSLKDRKFVQVDRDNFDEVMARMRPGLSIKVDNTLKDDQSELLVELQFRSMDDFEPGAVAERIPAIKALLDVRNRLRDLLTKADRSEELEELLERVLQSEGALKELAADLEHKDGTATNGAVPANGAAAAQAAPAAPAPAADGAGGDAGGEAKGKGSKKEPKS